MVAGCSPSTDIITGTYSITLVPEYITTTEADTDIIITAMAFMLNVGPDGMVVGEAEHP